MILLTILAIILVLLTIFVVAAVGVGGSIFIVVFADVIVCALVIAWIMKRLVTKKKTNK